MIRLLNKNILFYFIFHTLSIAGAVLQTHLLIISIDKDPNVVESTLQINKTKTFSEITYLHI